MSVSLSLPPSQVMLLMNEPVDGPRGPLDLVNGSRGVVIAWDHLPPCMNHQDMENGGRMLKGQNGEPQMLYPVVRMLTYADACRRMLTYADVC